VELDRRVGRKPSPASIRTDSVATTVPSNAALLSILTRASAVPWTASTACWIVGKSVGTAAVSAPRGAATPTSTTAIGESQRNREAWTAIRFIGFLSGAGGQILRHMERYRDRSRRADSGGDRRRHFGAGSLRPSRRRTGPEACVLAVEAV
jgi:hypothetical protein